MLPTPTKFSLAQSSAMLIDLADGMPNCVNVDPLKSKSKDLILVFIVDLLKDLAVLETAKIGMFNIRCQPRQAV